MGRIHEGHHLDLGNSVRRNNAVRKATAICGIMSPGSEWRDSLHLPNS